MNKEELIIFTDNLIYAKTGRHLNTLEIEILKGAWFGGKYEQIAQNYHCSDQHVKRVGAKLWKLISLCLEEKITKKNFKATIERRMELCQSSQKTANRDAIAEKSRELKLVESELPQGPIALKSQFYIQRLNVESECYREILKPGALIRIKAPGDMGKSSLMARIVDRSIQEGYNAIYLNFQLADSNFFSDLNLFLKWFCLSVGDKLQLSDRLDNYWKDIYGIKRRCHNYFEKYLLAEVDRPIVLALDEVNYAFKDPIANDFFSLLRAWHEQAKSDRNSKIWQKLRLVLSHSTEAYPILNVNQSPFNVGLAIDLPEFILEQIEDLARRHGLSLNRLEIEQLRGMVGGHPYLLQIAFYHLARKKMSLFQLLELAPTDGGPYGSHLQRHLSKLQAQPKLKAALKTILNETTAVRLNYAEKFKLHGMGLVVLEGNKVRLRCELYRQYFSDNIDLN